MSFATLLLLRLAGLGSPAMAPADTVPVKPLSWYVPARLLVHTAGGQGVAAVGAGWTSYRNRLAFEVLAGYLPKSLSITPMGIFTAKLSYTPWQLPIKGTGWRVQPFTVGGFVNYSASRGLTTTRGSKYDEDYYWWSSHTREGAFVGSSVGYALKPTRQGRPRSVMAYYELGTNDLYFISWTSAKGSLPFKDILTLGFGLRAQLW
ncbi:hypothetical protein [Hymenobacter daeguensis]